MRYFQVVCAAEFSLFFELPAWEHVILQATVTEPALHHAALAIGALTSSRYHPDMWGKRPTIEFSVRHYSMAIQELGRQLDESSQSLEVAIIASVAFSYIEFLLGLESRIEIHVQAGRNLLEDLYKRLDRRLEVSNQGGPSWQVSSLSAKCDLLANAMFQVTAQVSHSMVFESDQQ